MELFSPEKMAVIRPGKYIATRVFRIREWKLRVTTYRSLPVPSTFLRIFLELRGYDKHLEPHDHDKYSAKSGNFCILQMGKWEN